MSSVSESLNVQAASPTCVPATDGFTVGYCVCRGPDDGRKMICCDNSLCTVQWYHVRCLKLKNVPKGKLYCPLCRGKSAQVCKYPERLYGNVYASPCSMFKAGFIQKVECQIQEHSSTLFQEHFRRVIRTFYLQYYQQSHFVS